MITKENISELLVNYKPGEIIEAMTDGDYCKFTLSIFNTGHITHIEGVDYDEEEENETIDNGGVYCDWDAFGVLLDESGYKDAVLKQWIADNYHRAPDIDLHNYLLDSPLPWSIEHLTQTIDDDGGFNVDVMYYAKAIQYLTENDNSLMESLSLAADMGLNTDDLNSEVLASLLASEQARIDFYNISDELSELIEQLNEIGL